MIAKSLDVIHDALLKLRPQLIEAHGTISHTKKADRTSLTELDVLVEEELIKALSGLDGSVGFYGEEFGQQGSSARFWTIDPIDGTEAFIRGLPFCTNMLAYIEDGEVLASVIYNFVLDQYYQAQKGKGATCNGSPIRVSIRDITHACVEFEIRQDVTGNRDIYFDIPRFSLVKFSAAGFGFCQVASGCTEARVSYDSYGKIWDYAPGTLLVAEAGGIVANIGQTQYRFDNTNIIASNAVIHQDLQDYFKKKRIVT